MSVRALALLLVLSWIPRAVCAQSASSFDAVPAAMQAFVDRGEAAGVVTLLATRDKVLHLGAAGLSDMAAGRRMRTDDIFWIASMSKPITAVAIAILVDDGKVAFDDPLAKYLPEFRDLQVAADSRLVRAIRPITLRDVLTHTSGFGELTERDPHLTLTATSLQLSREPLRFQPGSRWAYSTAGFDILGRVAEVASGIPFDRFLQQRVFDPLGMKDTSFWIRPTVKGRWARSYQWVTPESRLRETSISYMYGTDVTDSERAALGGAGLFSTASDIARFYQMMLNKGQLRGHRILKPETVAAMIRKQTGNLSARPGMPWGLGFSVVEEPAAMEANKVLSPQSFGHGGAYSTQSWADPVKGLIWIVMFQRNGKGNPDNSDVRIAFQSAVPPRYR